MRGIGRRSFLLGLLGCLSTGLATIVEARGGGGRGGDRRRGPRRPRFPSPPRLFPSPRPPRHPKRKPGPHFRHHFGRPHSITPLPHSSRNVAPGRVKTVDGDTFRNGGERVRVRGLNAPEMWQPGGVQARARLDQLLRSGNVTMSPRGVDKYGRTVADVQVNGQNVTEIMRLEGLAK